LFHQLPFLAPRRFALGRSFTALVVDVIDGADNADWNDKEAEDTEQQIRHCRLLLKWDQFRLEC